LECKNTIVTLKSTVKVLSHRWHSGGASQEEKRALPEKRFCLARQSRTQSGCPRAPYSPTSWIFLWANVQLQKRYRQSWETNFFSNLQKNRMVLLDTSQNLVFRWHEGWAVVCPLGVRSEGGVTEPRQAAAQSLRQAVCHSMQTHVAIQCFELYLIL